MIVLYCKFVVFGDYPHVRSGIAYHGPVWFTVEHGSDACVYIGSIAGSRSRRVQISRTIWHVNNHQDSTTPFAVDEWRPDYKNLYYRCRTRRYEMVRSVPDRE